MDPSIMKLLEEDEDETMHSGADVEAFTAALNRDIEGDTSTSQPSDSDSVALSQGSNHTSSQLFPQWQTSSQDENANFQNHQDLNGSQQQDPHSSEMELKQHGVGPESQQQQIDTSQELKQPQDDRQQRQLEQNPFRFSQTLGVQSSEKNPVHNLEPDRTHNPESESHNPKLQNMNNQQAMTTEQARNPMNSGKQVPFAMLLPVLQPQLDKDRAMQLHTLYYKLKKNEISKDGFVRHMRGIVGDQMLKMAVYKLQAQAARNSQTGPNQFSLQSQVSAQQHHLKMPPVGAQQGMASQSFAQLHQKGVTSPTDPSHIPSSAAQLKTDSSNAATDNNGKKSQEMERHLDSHGMPASQMSSSSLSNIKQERERSTIPIQGLSKQQQQHLHFSQSSFPIYGSTGGNYGHPFSGTNVNSSAASLKQQPHDSQMRQGPIHQSIGATQLGTSTQVMNVLNVPNFERQNPFSEPKRVQGGTLTHLTNNSTLQQNSVQWQSSASKEQKNGALSSMTHVKQEPVDQGNEQQHKSQLSSPQGLSSFSPLQVERGNAITGTLEDETQPSRMSITAQLGLDPNISGDSHAFWGYGNVAARDWYMELPDAVRHIVDQAGFGAFCRGLSRLTASRPLLAALVERWWDTTNSFHFSAAGDMTMTPYDFSMLTGIGVGGDPIRFDTDMDEWKAAQIYLLGEMPPLARPGFIRYSWFESRFRTQPGLAEEAPMAQQEVEQYARGFLMFLLGTTIFANRANTVPLCLLSALVDVTRILRFDWGGAALATLYGYMSSASRYSWQLLGGYWRAWELWVYAYFPRLAPVPDVETPLVVPFSRRFDVRCVRRPRESFIFFRRYFDTITPAEITWQPWAPLPAVIRDQFAGAEETARFRILLKGPVYRAWYLGERFLRQTLGLPKQIVPGPPPTHMRETERFTPKEMTDYTIGWDAEGFRGEGESDYAEYVRTYIMRPLSSGRRAKRERPAAPVAGAGAGVGTSRTARVRGKSGARRGWGASWPALPTTMTCRGRGGATYQIPIAPPPADHELVGFYGLPPASSEYTRQSMELTASVMGMLQQILDLLAIYNIPSPFQLPTVGGASAGPSAPTRDGRVYPRTKAKCTHIGSSSRVPVPDDDEFEAEEEAEAESSEEETGDGTDSGSNDDADDDAPGPSSRKRTRTDP